MDREGGVQVNLIGIVAQNWPDAVKVPVWSARRS
jgi:hypothetical protein